MCTCVDTNDRLSPVDKLNVKNAKFGVAGEEEPQRPSLYPGCRTVEVNTQHWYDPLQTCGRIQK